ncbi:MAG: hypothetical protein ACREU3_07665 [Steroidobacteraceae bacterium]
MATTDDTRAEEAQPTPVPLSEKLRLVAVELGICHSAVALTAKALGACETDEERASAGSWAADELGRLEVDLEDLADTMCSKWIDVQRLEKTAAAGGGAP